MSTVDAPEHDPHWARRHVWHGVGAYALACTGAGTLAGGLWRAIVKLPVYRLDASNHALIAERGLAAIFSADAWFALLGAVIGVVLGGVAWRFLHRWGWRVVIIGLLGSLLAGSICWLVGTTLGPGRLEDRLATAQVGDLVPVDLELHAYSTLALWPFGAMIPILVMSSMRRDHDAPGDSSAARTAATPASTGSDPQQVPSAG